MLIKSLHLLKKTLRNMRKNIFLLLVLTSFMGYTQEVVKDSVQVNKNPIIYADANVSYVGSSISGAYHFGFALNYQRKKNLYTVFVNHNQGMKSKFLTLALTGIPIFYRKFYSDEYGAMYGRRWNPKLGKSYSVSAGLSFTDLVKNDNFLVDRKEEFKYVGVPIQLSIRWFKKEKKRFRVLYGAIPVGKPTSIGRSFGFKIIGNISKNSYIGAGITIGLGIHQKYN